MVGTGHLLGGPDTSPLPVFALGAGSRDIAAGLVVAGTGIDDPAVTVMLPVASVFGLVLLLVHAKAMRPRASA